MAQSTGDPRRRFSARSAARELIVMGGVSGIGVETVRALAEAGARVVLATRDHSRGGAVAARLRRETRSR
jgi:NAD(P)-dependent dehydrogenase (short-subunit alcohol dehydrogenase family)